MLGGGGFSFLRPPPDGLGLLAAVLAAALTGYESGAEDEVVTT